MRSRDVTAEPRRVLHQMQILGTQADGLTPAQTCDREQQDHEHVPLAAARAQQRGDFITGRVVHR
jgi:hypothetical protein